MSSTRQSIPYVGLLGGMDGTTPPYLLSGQQWSEQHGFRNFNRKLSQVLLRRLLGALPVSVDVYSIKSVPSGITDQCLFVALTSNGVYQLRPSSIASSPLLLYEDGTTPALGSSRWATTMYNNQIWFTNLETPLHYTDGTRVAKYSTELPKARHIEVFYDHIIVGYVEFKGEITPWRVQWSHLYDPSLWTPGAENEADHFDCVEWQEGDSPVLEVTGLHRLNDVLFVFLPDAIVGARYVGLPKGFQFGAPWAPIFTGVGNSYAHSSVSRGSAIYFFDEATQDFYELSPKGLRSIGQPIRETLAANTLLVNRQQMVGMILPEFYEVWWVLDSQAYVYNWLYETWFFDFGQSQRSIGPRTGMRAKTVDELAGTCDALAGSCNGLSTSGEGEIRRLYGSAAGNVFREAQSADADNSLTFPNVSRYLTTGDRFYGDLYSVKETDAVTISATYKASTCLGILVELAVRNHLDDAIVYEVLGTWTPAEQHKRLTFPKKSGKIFRWRLMPLDVDGTKPARDVKISSFQEHVYGGKAEQ